MNDEELIIQWDEPSDLTAPRDVPNASSVFRHVGGSDIEPSLGESKVETVAFGDDTTDVQVSWMNPDAPEITELGSDPGSPGFPIR